MKIVIFRRVVNEQLQHPCISNYLKHTFYYSNGFIIENGTGADFCTPNRIHFNLVCARFAPGIALDVGAALGGLNHSFIELCYTYPQVCLRACAMIRATGVSHLAVRDSRFLHHPRRRSTCCVLRVACCVLRNTRFPHFTFHVSRFTFHVSRNMDGMLFSPLIPHL